MSGEALPPELSGRPPPSRPKVPLAIEEGLAALTMAAVAIITFANVLARYFSDLSFAFTEEVSVWLMVVMTFLGAAVAVVRDRHMRISFVADKLPPPWRRRAEAFTLVAILAMFAILAIWGTSMAYDDYRFEVTSPALGIDQWLYTAWLPLLAGVVAARALGKLIRLWREDLA
jgi:TRAP-type C4-dicarboxylate transport system permease small subunit